MGENKNLMEVWAGNMIFFDEVFDGEYSVTVNELKHVYLAPETKLDSVCQDIIDLGYDYLIPSMYGGKINNQSNVIPEPITFNP